MQYRRIRATYLRLIETLPSKERYALEWEWLQFERELAGHKMTKPRKLAKACGVN